MQKVKEWTLYAHLKESRGLHPAIVSTSAMLAAPFIYSKNALCMHHYRPEVLVPAIVVVASRLRSNARGAVGNAGVAALSGVRDVSSGVRKGGVSATASWDRRLGANGVRRLAAVVRRLGVGSIAGLGRVVGDGKRYCVGGLVAALSNSQDLRGVVLRLGANSHRNGVVDGDRGRAFRDRSCRCNDGWLRSVGWLDNDRGDIRGWVPRGREVGRVDGRAAVVTNRGGAGNPSVSRCRDCRRNVDWAGGLGWRGNRCCVVVAALALSDRND
jgi:hypothetical protein